MLDAEDAELKIYYKYFIIFYIFGNYLSIKMELLDGHM